MKKVLQLDFKNASIEEGSNGKQVVEYDKELLPLYTRSLEYILMNSFHNGTAHCGLFYN